MIDLRSLNVEDIMADPTRFGLPTFDEFKKNPDAYKKREDQELISADGSSQVFRKLINKQRYAVNGYECKSLEEVERVARAEGIWDNLAFVPQIIPIGAGKCDILIHFVSKDREQNEKQAVTKETEILAGLT